MQYATEIYGAYIYIYIYICVCVCVCVCKRNMYIYIYICSICPRGILHKHKKHFICLQQLSYKRNNINTI
jgi:hypothetical protein